MKNVYMIVHELDINKGGMTTAMLTRSKMFLENNINGDIITFDYKIDYTSILEKLVNSKKMDPRTKMFNPFIFYKAKSDKSNSRRNSSFYKTVANIFKNNVEIKENEHISRYFNKKNGEYVAYKNKDGDNYFLDLFENNIRYKRLNFYNKKLHRIDVFNKDNKLIAEQFYDNNSYLYLYRQINPSNGNIGKTYLINEQKQFKNNVAFCSYFLEELIEDSNENFMICDGPGSFPKMLETNHKFAKKFAVIHINHHKNFDGSGAIKQKEDYILKNTKKINGVIVLTEAQKKDIVKEFEINNVYVISNFINITDKFKEKQSKKIVGHISRLVPQKGLPYLIEVAEKVIKENEDIEFHIYGDGEEKEKLKKLISNKDIENNVKLLGYTDNPLEKIREFGCVVSTSQFEGQGLSIIEAMLLEKPVIAFDIKYGPSDFIKNAENGYLIKNKDTTSMASKILELLNNKELAHQYGIEARNTIIDLYEPQKLMSKWMELLN